MPDAELGEGPSGVAVDPGTHTIYAPNHSDGTVSVINGSTRTVTATVPVGKDPEAWQWTRAPTPSTSPTPATARSR
jgi:YVTN family beta-propeller protein